MRVMEAAAQRSGLTLQPVEARSPEDFDMAFATIIQGRAEALYMMANGLNLRYRRRITRFAVKHHLPVIADRTSVTYAGGLMSYQHDRSEMERHIAVIVDKILKGAKPADLPVEQPMRFQLAINLKTAKILGLTLPPTLLVQADEVIQAAAAGTIPRPPEVRILPPAAHLPPEVATFSGTWEGVWGGGLPSRLVIEEIDMTSARVVYAWADHPQRPFPGGWVRVRAKVLPGGTLQWLSDVTFTFTMTKDRLSIEGERIESELGEAEQRSTVIMKKVERE